MTRFIQIHALTAYPPANLNRDDVGRPKTAMFGGTSRLRISSQSLKRAWRKAWRAMTVEAQDISRYMGERTQRFGQQVEAHLRENGSDAETSRKIARAVADIFGAIKKESDKNPTYIEQLAFISPEERKVALELAERMAKGEKVEANAQAVLQRADTAIDIAMFGRMLADDPDFNREAAVQVAHAITTHRCIVEDDYYTAVDDLKVAAEDAGAGFVGEAGFGAGVFYLYLCVDKSLLCRNLGGDEGLANLGLKALIEAVATVSPSGKQASFASRARASYVMVEKGDNAPRTLAAAFLRPIEPKADQPDILETSITALERTRNDFARAYGDETNCEVMNCPVGTGTLADVIAFAVA